MSPGWWVAALVVLLVVWIVLEGKRQERVHGKSRRRGLMRAGLLDLQKHLEPERKIEMLVEERDDTVEDEAAAPPEGGRARAPSDPRA